MSGARIGRRAPGRGGWRFWLLVLVAWVATGCSSDPDPAQRRRVLIVSVDTLRADFLSAAGYDRPTTPFVDSLLAEGVWFTRAITPIPRTTPAVASLLTGRHPGGHGVRVLFDRLADDVPYLPEAARAHGYTTVAVVSNHILAGARGLERGFDVFDAAGDARDAAATTRAAVRALEDLDRDAALFVWVHYIDPHVPYHPPPTLARDFDPGYAGRYALHFGASPGATGEAAYPRDLPKRRAVYANPLPEPVRAHVRRLYAADIRATDEAIGELVGWLRTRFGPDWLIVFTADHGEDLGEHGLYYDHGDLVSEAALRVPLAFVLPPGDPLRRSGRVDTRVSLVDVAPSLAELLALDARALVEGSEGRSLVPALRGRPLPETSTFAESGRSFYPAPLGESGRRVHFDVAGRLRAVSDGRYKLVFTPGAGEESRALYDLLNDPQERQDLFHPDHPALPHLERELSAWAPEAFSAGERPAPTDPSREDTDRLRRLGYVE